MYQPAVDSRLPNTATLQVPVIDTGPIVAFHTAAVSAPICTLVLTKITAATGCKSPKGAFDTHNDRLNHNHMLQGKSRQTIQCALNMQHVAIANDSDTTFNVESL